VEQRNRRREIRKGNGRSEYDLSAFYIYIYMKIS
jgi:hypothetical protein